MAITILDKPTSPNLAGTKLVYTISSSNATQPQFQYVTNILRKEVDETTPYPMTTLYTYPNLTGNGIIDIAQIVTDNLEYVQPGTFALNVPTETFKDFILEFSESYGSSISSSTTEYSGGAEDKIRLINGITDPNQGSFNWQDSGSFQVLSNQPEGYIGKENFLTTYFLRVSGSDNAVSIRYKDENESTLSTYNLILSSSASGSILGIGIGNYSFLSSSFDLDWKTIEISDSGSDDAGLAKYNLVEPCDDGITTFVFTNKYGVHDFYASNKPVRRVTDIDRKTYDQSYVDYSSLQSIYSQTNRGETQYKTQYNDRYEITFDYVDKATADWLTELIDSPDVYIQGDGRFEAIPIVITNSSYTWNTNENRQKLFQYTIQYQYANQRYDR